MLEIVFAIAVLAALAGVVWILERRTSSSDSASVVPGATMEEVKFSLNRPTRFLIILTVVVLALAAALYGTIWVITHPDSPITTTHIVGDLAVLVGLARIIGWNKQLKNWLK